MLQLSDGTAQVQGDGTDGHMCQVEDSNRRCLSTGECRRCKFIETSLDGTASNKYEGCVITSDTPICDANKGTTNVVEYAKSKYKEGDRSTYAPEAGTAHLLTPECVKCKKQGKICLHVQAT